MISAKTEALAGTISEGLSTTELPNAMAGAIFQAATATGKFHGVITSLQEVLLSPQYQYLA